MSLSSVLKSKRKDLGLTLNDIAEQMGVSEATVQRWESGNIKSLRHGRITKLAAILNVSPSVLMGWDEGENEPDIPPNAIPYRATGMVPVLGRIPAGLPALAEEYIEGYEPVDVSDPENYYWLRVEGDSMINAGISTGDLVLIRMQPCAENGQIVACRVNGDEATLKRYHEQGDSIILMPENPDYEPRIIRKKEFDIGYAAIMGVAVEIKRKL